jgi:hypothetical protein
VTEQWWIADKQVKLKELGQKLAPLSICVQSSHGHPGWKSRPGGEMPVSDFLTCGADNNQMWFGWVVSSITEHL